MKKLLLSWLCCAVALTAFGQKQRDVRQIAELLEKSKVFVEYRKFRSSFEAMNAEAAKHLRYRDDYDKLNAAYNGIQVPYNALLGTIKKDLSTLSTIHQMVTTPAAFANRYLDRYQAVVTAYEKDYLPIYKALTAPDRSTLKQGKAISPAMVILGIELFLELVDLIQSRKTGQDEDENYVLATVNAYFIRKLEMKPWADLGILPPDAVLENDPTSIKTTLQPRKKLKTKVKTSNQLVAIPALYDQLEGWLEVEVIEPGGRSTAKMALAQNKSKDIGVEALKNRDGQVERWEMVVQIPVFQSKRSYPEGTQFQINVQNTAGMYVFALQSDGKVQALYPYNQESIKGCKGMGKDIGVMPATFVTGRNTAQVTTLPAPDCSTTPPQPRYFTLQPPMPSSKTEQFCLLLTKAEINTEMMVKLMNQAKGDLPERLSTVLGHQIISELAGGLSLKKERLNFKAHPDHGTVLPLVFGIKRK